MDSSVLMRTLNNWKRPHTICLRFEDFFFTSLTKLVLEEKVSICSAIKENLRLYCCKWWVLVVVVIIQHILIISSISQRNTACNRVFTIESLVFKNSIIKGVHSISVIHLPSLDLCY